MKNAPFFVLMLAAAVGCSAPEPQVLSLAEELRTADPYARGYTDADFPRVQELAEGVFTYEQLRSAGDEKFTTGFTSRPSVFSAPAPSGLVFGPRAKRSICH